MRALKCIILLVLLMFFCSIFSGISSALEDLSPFKIPLSAELADPGSRLYFSIVCHVEPFEGGRMPDYRDEKYFKAQVGSLLKFTQMLEKHGAKLTLQVQRPFTDSLLKWGNPLPDLEKKGHEIATHFHEDHWVKTTAPRDERLQTLKNMKSSVDQLGVNNETLCGGWLWTDLSEVAHEASFRYVDNYKNPKTQRGLKENLTVFPYRMEGGVLYVSEGYWPDKEKLASFPARTKAEDFDRLSQMLNSSFIELIVGKICTANVVMHLSDFNLQNEASLIKLYDDYLTKILDPVVQTGLVKYSTIAESGKLFEEKEKRTYLFAFNKVMPKDPIPLQKRGVASIERISKAVADYPFLINTLIEPVMSEEDYRSGKVVIKVSQRKVFDEFESYAKNVNPQDIFMVYSHSHGLKNYFHPKEPWGGICLDAPPIDGSSLPHQGVTVWPQYTEKLLAIPAQTVILMVMSCYSGGFVDYLIEIEDQWKSRADEGRNFIVLTSQNSSLMSGAVNIEGELINSFTFAVEQAFLGKADGYCSGEADGLIQLEEWVRYILDTTHANNSNAFPKLIGSYDPNFVLFAKNP